MSQKHTRFLILFIVAALIYLGRGILGTFVLAALAAYLLSPLVIFIHKKVRISRTLSILIVYLAFLFILSSIFYFFISRLFTEVKEFSGESLGFISLAKGQLSTSPDWVQNLAADSLKSLQSLTASIPARIFSFFTGAISSSINLMVFLTATFYFLKDGPTLANSFRRFLEESSSEKMSKALEKVSQVFSRYLRGQLFLVILMSTVSFLLLTLLDVKFGLLIGIFTGFAEIVPIIGPIVATIIAATVAVLDGRAMGGLDVASQAGLVVLFYFIFRQVEDVVVIPHVMGKVARVHPLIIMFAVILGGHISGTWGLFLAVPVLAALKILFEIYW